MHPLNNFKYCPECGSPRFVENNFKSKKCEQCHFVYYFNSAAATAAFITDEFGRLLVARRAHEPAKGTLDLPGGFIDLREAAEEAIVREVKEETNLIVKPKYLFSLPNLYLYSGMEIHTLDMFFHCVCADFSNLQAADDVEELLFLDKSKLNPELFGLESIRKAVQMYSIFNI
jgi:ADP-ribose pyrophosphatase